MGIEDTNWLAWLLSQGQQSQYTAQRHPVGAQVLRLTHRFTALAQSHGIIRDLALDWGLPLLSQLPAVQRRLFSMLSAQDTPAPPWL